MFNSCRRIADAAWFQNSVIVIILITAVLLGLKTSHTLMDRFGGLLHAVDYIIQAIFVVEITIRLLAYGPRFHRFFTNGWNVFDFTVVALSLLPTGSGPVATVARIARVLRVARLVSLSDELKLIVTTMLKSIPSMGHVLLLISMLLYIYGILGFYLFGAVAPEHFGTLGRSMLTMFEVLTLEGWVDVQSKTQETYQFSWVFYASFVVIAVFVVVNLFIAVVMNNLEAAKEEHTRRKDAENPNRVLLAKLGQLQEQIRDLEIELRSRV
jgi:voltage-gated sodium channel